MTRRSGSEDGAALIVVLMLLVIVTVLGLAAMRGAILQERMAAATTARAIAFQAAESGMRQAELLVRDATVAFPAAGCAAGRCSNPGTGTPAWQSAGFWDNGGAGYQLGAAVGDGISAIAPKFVIEDFGTAATATGGNNCVDVSKPCIKSATQNIYRITSYASTPSGSEVVLQSLYRR